MRKKIFFFVILIGLISVSGYADTVLYQSRDATFYVSFSGGISMPLGDLSSIMKTGYTLRGYGGYLFQFEMFDIGLGGVIGMDYFTTRENVPSPYILLVFPVAVHAQITSKFNLPFRLFLELDTGVSYNGLFFSGPDEDVGTMRVFLQIAAGVGNDVADLLNISQFIGLTIVFFEDPAYVMLNPGLRVEVKF